MIDDLIKKRINECLLNRQKITFLVGAGISAESGIPTFRGKDGFWISGSKNYKAQEIGTYRMFSLASDEVWKWFLYRKSLTEKAKPNQSHLMLKEIEDKLKDYFILISQNVDSLHKKAGNSLERTYLIHGDMDFVRCGDECSDELYPFPKGINLTNRNKEILTPDESRLLTCPKCGNELRPHVLWFDEFYNEKYYKLDSALRISNATGILFILGTSGATNLPQQIVNRVLNNGGMVVEINTEDSYFSENLRDEKFGLVIKGESSPFLTELNNVIADLVMIKEQNNKVNK
jgi:NAD-dependent deacetylase